MGLNIRAYIIHRTYKKDLSFTYSFFSYQGCIDQISKGPASKDFKDLQVLQPIKFVQAFFLLITLTASLLNVVSAQNPWSMEPQFDNPTVMIVLLGLVCVDTFFTISAFLAFHYANRIYKERGGLSLKDILKLYVYRILRFVPGSYLILFFGIYVMPLLHGGTDDRPGNPIWFSFEQVLFYECSEPKTLASKLLFYSNLYPYYQDDKYGCM